MRRLRGRHAVGAAGLALIATMLARTPARPACRDGDPLAGVYRPTRLQVIDRCRTVTGTVVKVRREEDGDYHINVKLDSEFEAMLTERNRTGQGGALVVEIVPADQARVIPPQVGRRVRVTGPYVLDKEHGGWAEIHPAREVEVLK